MVEHFEDSFKQDLAFRIVVMSFIGRGPNRNQEVRSGESQVSTQARIGYETGDIDVLLNPRIGHDATGLCRSPANYVRKHHHRGTEDLQSLHELVIAYHYRGN